MAATFGCVALGADDTIWRGYRQIVRFRTRFAADLIGRARRRWIDLKHMP